MFKAAGRVVLKLAGKGCVQVYCYYIFIALSVFCEYVRMPFIRSTNL